MNNRFTIWRNARMKNVMAVVFLAFVLIMSVMMMLFYNFALKNHERNTLIKLQGISNSLSLQIDGNLHETLIRNYHSKDTITTSGQDSSYQIIHRILKDNYQADMLKSPIYTLVKDDQDSIYRFAVTSNDQPYFWHEYRSFPVGLLEMYSKGGTLPAYKDEFGTWLSAFSAIKNKAGKTVALVMVDEKTADFIKIFHQTFFKAILIAGIIFLIMFLFLFFILKEILYKENKDKILLVELNAENAAIKQELVFAYSQLSKINDLRKEMIANLSHDLRTPLVSISGFLEFLIDNPDLSHDEQKKYLQIAYTESQKMNGMIGQLFELSKLESDNIELQKVPFLLHELISDVLQKYALPLKAKSIELKSLISPDSGLVFGDIRYIERLFQNLLDNAVKHVYTNGFIKITIQEESKQVLVKVCNLGDPIPSEELPHIFDRYYKVSDNKKAGAGLGLAIAKKICDLHDGTIAASVDGQVVSFWFTLPRYR